MKQLKFVKRTIVAAVLSAGFASIASASAIDGVAIELKGGLLGLGGEVNYAINPMFTVGLGLNTFTQSMSQSASDIDYDVDFKLQTIALLGNYHPFEGTFRITAGAMLNNNELSMTANPTVSYDIGGTTYTAGQVGTLKSTVDFNAIAPYLGLGWGKSAGSGFGVTFDMGVLFQGSPNVSMKASGAIASNPTFIANLNAEEASAEDDIKDFTMFPVMSLGLNYRF